jgi:UbiD family decarboxylase
LRDISDAIKILREEDFLEEIDKILSCRYEAAKIIDHADKRGKAVIFRTDCSPETISVANIISRREILYKFLDVRDDKDLYYKIRDAMNRPTKISSEKTFDNYYKRITKDLRLLPALYFYERDGGRYFTSSIVIAKDPFEDIYNASIHRIMILDSDKCVARIVPRHLYRIMTEYRKVGRETPIAICFSPSPLVELAASMQPEYGVFELEIANTFMNNNLEVCRTPIHNLPVPCSCSHVIEARITLEDVDEGPFTDILSTYDIVRKQPLIKIDEIYMSLSSYPFHIILPGGNEHKILMGISKEAEIYFAVSKVVRKVHKIRLTRGGGMWLHAIISIEKNHDGDAKNAILAAFAAHPSLKMVVAVDSDIDPDDLEQVEWALATRFQASRGLIIISNARLSSLDPSSRDGLGDKMGIDATVPLAEREKFERARIP